MSESPNCLCVNQSLRNSEQFCENNRTNFKWRVLSALKGNSEKVQVIRLVSALWENARVSAKSVCGLNPYPHDHTLV